GIRDFHVTGVQTCALPISARWPGLRTAAFGDLFLEDIRQWRAQQLARAGWELLTPLFGQDTAALARRTQAEGLRAELCCVDTMRSEERRGGEEGRAHRARQ